MKYTPLQILFILFIIGLKANSQVKTKTYPQEISEIEFPLYLIKGEKYKIYPPPEFIYLKELNKNTVVNSNRFAVRNDIEIDFLKIATLIQRSGNCIYSLTLESDEAISLSLKFSEFNLTKSSILSIYTKYELTDSITAAENNPAQKWQTRSYNGNTLNIILQIPSEEVMFAKLKIASVYLGFKEYDNTPDFGSPGASATCNVNVVCPQGSGWANERNSVAIIKADDSHFCGALVMNTCGTNRPFLLTANHARAAKPDVDEYVFQFLFFSTDCNSNVGYREDLQFYGSTLKAASALSDFTLLELNQIPAANTGLTYAGWTTQTNQIFSTTMLHHPAADVMKISQDYQSPQFVTLQPSGMQCWRTELDLGGFQGGSSGGPLFNQSRRIIGQLFGKRTENLGDPCHPEAFSGRFHVSWTGDGTNETRLSNWLDPNNSGATSTNTTNVNALFAHVSNPTLNIGGTPTDSYICSGSSTYTLSGMPANVNATIVWSVSNPSAASIPNPSNGTSVVVTKTGDAVVTLTATVTICGQQPITVNKTIMIGASVGGYYIINSNYHQPIQRPLYTNNSPVWLPANQSFGISAYINSSNVQSASWVRASNSYPFNWISFGSTLNFSGASAPTSYTTRNGIFTITAQTTCGTYVGTYTWPVITQGWGFRIQMNPNPATDNLIVSLLDESTEIKALGQDEVITITLYDLNRTNIVKQWALKNNQSRFNLNISDVKSGQYVLLVQKGQFRKSEKVLIQ